VDVRFSMLSLQCINIACSRIAFCPRWLPPMSLPTVRGRCQGVTLGVDAAMFVADTGEADVFNSTTLCWTSYKVRP
jgi:hypothetical protein